MVVFDVKEVILPGAGDDLPDCESVNVDKWWKRKNLRTLNFLSLLPLMSMFTLGFDVSLISGLMAMPQWEIFFGLPDSVTLGIIVASYPIGGILITPFLGLVTGKLGRKAGLYAGATVCCIGAALQATAKDLAWFCVARGFLGAGGTFAAASGAALVIENAHPMQRSVLAALFLTSTGLGSVVAAWTDFGTFRYTGNLSWRIPSGMQALPSVLQMLGMLWLPESPRWLMSKGRKREAERMIGKYHAEGDVDDPLVAYEIKVIERGIWRDRLRKGGYVEFVRTKGNRRRLSILIFGAWCAQSSGASIVGQFMSKILASIGITDTFHQTLIIGLQSILGWISAIFFAACLMNRFNRRALFLTSLLATASCLAIITIGSSVVETHVSNRAAALSVLVFLFVFFPANNLGFAGTLGLYISEILPFDLRIDGIAVFSIAQLAFSTVNIFGTSVLLTYFHWKLYLVFIGIVLAELVTVWFIMPETRGISLEEIENLFDGPPRTQYSECSPSGVTSEVALRPIGGR